MSDDYFACNDCHDVVHRDNPEMECDQCSSGPYCEDCVDGHLVRMHAVCGGDICVRNVSELLGGDSYGYWSQKEGREDARSVDEDAEEDDEEGPKRVKRCICLPSIQAYRAKMKYDLNTSSRINIIWVCPHHIWPSFNHNEREPSAEELLEFILPKTEHKTMEDVRIAYLRSEGKADELAEAIYAFGKYWRRGLCDLPAADKA
jgi:hypothetical protein